MCVSFLCYPEFFEGRKSGSFTCIYSGPGIMADIDSVYVWWLNKQKRSKGTKRNLACVLEKDSPPHFSAVSWVSQWFRPQQQSQDRNMINESWLEPIDEIPTLLFFYYLTNIYWAAAGIVLLGIQYEQSRHWSFCLGTCGLMGKSDINELSDKWGGFFVRIIGPELTSVANLPLFFF